MTEPDDVLTVDEAARLFKVCRNTLYAEVNRNAIPHRRIGKQIRLSRAVLMRWLEGWTQGAQKG